MIRIKDLSIERKLIAMQLLTTFIVLLFYGMLLFFNDLHVLKKSVINRLTSMAQLIGANSISALNFLDEEAAEKILSSLNAEQDIVNAWIYDADGVLFAKYSKSGYSNFAFPKLERESYEFGSDYTFLSKKIMQDSEIIGMISLRLSMEQSRYIVKRNVMIAVLVLAVGMLFALILSHITQGTISKPVLNLVAISKEVSETGNYSIRVEKDSNDEIGILCDTFNDMMTQIEKHERERDRAEETLKKSNEQLQKEILERNRAEQELKRTHKIYRKTIENSRGVPYQLSFCDWKYKFIGEGWEDLIGISPQNFILDQWDEITEEFIIADAKATTTDFPEYSAAFLRGEIERYRVDIRIITPGGEEKWISDCSLPLRDRADGKVIGSLGILQDITERKRVEQELEKHKEHLEELVETRTIELTKANERLQQEIEERKRAEQRVRANEETYRTVIEQTGQMVYDYDIASGKIRWLGDIHGTTGYTSDEFARVDIAAWEELIHPDDRAITLETLDETMKKCSKFDVEYRLKSKNGTYLDMKDNGVFLKDEKGNAYRMLGTMKDITKQKRMEQARRENEEKFERISTSAQDAIIIMDSEGKITYWNDAAMNTFGYIKEEAIGQVLHNFLAPQRYHEAYEKAYRKFQETGQGNVIGKTVELFGIRKNGKEFPFELSLSSVKIKNKWNAIGILRDITERKQAELALKESEASLANAQRIAHLGNWDWDIERNDLRWSEEIFHIFGLNPQKFGATYEAFLNSVHPDDRELVKISVNEALDKKQPYSIDHRIVQPDGTELIVHEQAEVFFNDAGKPIRMLGTVQDITDRKKAEQALKETQAQLVQSEKMASLGTLVAGVAHEINTPVGAISSMYDTLFRAVERLKSTLDIICTGDTKTHQKVEALFKIIEDANRVIASGTDRVTNIVRRLKSFARLDEAELQTVDIHEGIEDTLIIVHHELKRKAVVERNFSKIPPISCYPRQLNQVYLNLLVNAIQAIEDKGTITISTFSKNNHVYIQFKDTGIGIPDEALNKIFDPGYTTKGVGVGTGLGLSICYQIVKDHRGDILVESKVGKGTTFTIILPVKLNY